MRIRHACLLCGSLLIAACSSAPPLPDPQALDAAPARMTALDEAEWALLQRGGQWIVLADSRQTPRLRVDGAARQVSGFDGCNRFHGPLRVLDGHLKIGPLAATRRACPPSLAPEAEFRAALESAVHWEVRTGMLELRDAGGQPLLLFKAETPPAQ